MLSMIAVRCERRLEFRLSDKVLWRLELGMVNLGLSRRAHGKMSFFTFSSGLPPGGRYRVQNDTRV